MVAVPEVIVQRRLTFEDYCRLPDDQDSKCGERTAAALDLFRPTLFPDLTIDLARVLA